MGMLIEGFVRKYLSEMFRGIVCNKNLNFTFKFVYAMYLIQFSIIQEPFDGNNKG